MGLITKYNTSIILIGMLVAISSYSSLFGQVVSIDKNNTSHVDISNCLVIATDSTGDWSFEYVANNKQIWTPITGEILNFGMTQNTHWCKIKIDNQAENQYISIAEPTIDSIDIYFKNESGLIKKKSSGAVYNYKQREIAINDFLFKLPTGSYDCYLRLKSNFPLQTPIQISSLKYLMESSHKQDFGLALYFGLMLVMVLYNSFIYLFVKDKTYLYYILYIFLVTLTYASFKGLSFEYLWPNTPHLHFFIPSLSSLTGIFVLFFASSFLKTKKHLYKLSKIEDILIFLYLVSIVINLLGNYQLSAITSQLLTIILSCYLLGIGTLSYIKGVRMARFFLVAWTFFLISLIIYILKLNGLIAYNLFTNNSVLYGSALEAILLSIALADRINILKKEKEVAQQNEIKQRIEKEQILEEQAETLKTEVENATHELKEAQGQLVQSEKMASLGQLTAGIAHEINNPINFVKSNVRPLKRDINHLYQLIEKYEAIKSPQLLSAQLKSIALFKEKIEIDFLKEEITALLSGIDEGASRTVKIVDGLKSFSREGNASFQEYDLSIGIESCLAILQHRLSTAKINIQKKYIPPLLLECLPDRINQVFMNILDNAIDALNPIKGQKTIAIDSKILGKNLVISFADNGIGMSHAMQQKIFDPFYTSKDVGSGTGLGLSIVYGIITDHNGTIEVVSNEGQGTIFTIIFLKNNK